MDVPQEVVRRILDSHAMTQHYAQLSDTPIRRHWEKARKVSATGRAVTIDLDGALAEAAWAKQCIGRATQADPSWAVRVHGAADQSLAALGHTLHPLEAWLARLDRQRLRAAMGAESFEAEYVAGRALDPAQVLAAPGRRGAAAGRLHVDGEVPDMAMTVLTPRERDVLKLVAQGQSNKDIAQRLVLSEHAVHRHLANILRKLHLSSRSGRSLGRARRAGLSLTRTSDMTRRKCRVESEKPPPVSPGGNTPWQTSTAPSDRSGRFLHQHWLLQTAQRAWQPSACNS